MGAYDDKLYEVGKGKPPPQYRWKKGQSGNPRGPKKKVKPGQFVEADKLEVLMNEIVKPMIGDRQVPMTRREYILLQNINDAMTGTKYERRKATELLFRIGAFNVPPPDARDYGISVETATDFVEQLAAEFGFKAGDEIIPQ